MRSAPSRVAVKSSSPARRAETIWSASSRPLAVSSSLRTRRSSASSTLVTSLRLTSPSTARLAEAAETPSVSASAVTVVAPSSDSTPPSVTTAFIWTKVRPLSSITRRTSPPLRPTLKSSIEPS